MNGGQYRFGEWTLRASSGELQRNGSTQRLQEQPLRILLALLERPGEVVSREELIRRVWPEGVVEFDMGLNTAVRKLRLALEDDAETPRFVETLPRRGYRFIGTLLEVSPPSATPASPPPSPADPGQTAPPRRPRWDIRWAATAALVLAAVAFFTLREPAATPRSVAVLPFRALTADVHDPALALGVAGALVTRLSTVQALRIAPLGAVRRYDDPGVDPLQAGLELGVDAVLEGFLQQHGDRLRVSARLVRVADGRSLWSGQFDESVDDLLRVQDAIAERVTRAITPQLPGATRMQAYPAETRSIEAFRHFAAAQYNQFRRDTDGVPGAIASYEAALAADPAYVDAWAGLSVAHAVQAVFGTRPTAAAFDAARAAARRALELDAESAAALGAMGHVLIQADHRYSEGLDYYRRALDRNPDQAIVHQWLGIARAHLGDIEAGLEHLRMAQEMEPRTIVFAANTGMLLYFARRYDEAISHLQGLLRLEPRLDQALGFAGNAWLAKGETARAMEAFDAKQAPGPGGLGDRGRGFAAAADAQRARSELARLGTLGQQGFGVAHDKATIHLLLGEVPAACQALERAISDGSQMIGFLRVDPRLDALRNEPCYARVEARLYEHAPAAP